MAGVKVDITLEIRLLRFAIVDITLEIPLFRFAIVDITLQIRLFRFAIVKKIHNTVFLFRFSDGDNSSEKPVTVSVTAEK